MKEHIYGNVYIVPSSFKDFDRESVIPLITNVIQNIDTITHIPDVKTVSISASSTTSGCCEIASYPFNLTKEIERHHQIYIAIRSEEPRWKSMDWVSQFAHEYMHHAIDRKGTMKKFETLWFDEALCHISSIYQALRLRNLIERDPQILPITLDWCEELIAGEFRLLSTHANPQLFQSLSAGRGLQEFLPFPLESVPLAQAGASVARCCVNLFQMYPALWKIVPRMSEIPLDADIYQLFDYLRETADVSYRNPLDKLVNMLLPCH